jgi:hypothetical protein
LVNSIAERSAGFIWRYIDASGNATETRPYADPRIFATFSVWESVAALEHYVWQTVHKRFYGRRTDWFEPFEGPAVVLWWVPVGHPPTVDEAVARMMHFKERGPSSHAFDWQMASAQLWKTARCAPRGTCSVMPKAQVQNVGFGTKRTQDLTNVRSAPEADIRMLWNEVRNRNERQLGKLPFYH